MNKNNNVRSNLISNLRNTSQANRAEMQKNMRNNINKNVGQNNKNNVSQGKNSKEKDEADVVLKKIWSDNVMWTRFFIISAISGIGDLQIITKKLIKTPTEFSNVLKNYFDEESSKKFEALMMDHLLIGIKLINTAKSGNISAIKGMRTQWYKNADEISELMSSMNSNWNYNEWQKMLRENLKLTEDQVIKRFSRQYNDDILSFEKMSSLSIKMAEIMATGIIKQTK